MTMKFKRLMTLILAAMLLSPLAAASDPPSSNGKSAGDPEWLRDLQKWRDQRATALQAPGGGFH